MNLNYLVLKEPRCLVRMLQFFAALACVVNTIILHLQATIHVDCFIYQTKSSYHNQFVKEGSCNMSYDIPFPFKMNNLALSCSFDPVTCKTSNTPFDMIVTIPEGDVVSDVRSFYHSVMNVPSKAFAFLVAAVVTTLFMSLTLMLYLMTDEDSYEKYKKLDTMLNYCLLITWIIVGCIFALTQRSIEKVDKETYTTQVCNAMFDKVTGDGRDRARYQFKCNQIPIDFRLFTVSVWLGIASGLLSLLHCLTFL